VQTPLASIIRHRLQAAGSGLVIWFDPSALFASIVAAENSKLNVKRLSRDNVLQVRVELAIDTPAQHATLYCGDTVGLEPLEEIVQCYSASCTITVDQLLRDRGVQLESAHASLSVSHPSLLIEMWDRIDTHFWEAGDIDLGVALAFMRQERGDDVSLALAVLQATAQPPRLDLHMERTHLRRLGDAFVATLLSQRFRLAEQASVEDFITALVVHDLASTATGEGLVGHLARERDRVKFDRCVSAIARDREIRSSLSVRFQRVLDVLGVNLEELDLADLAELRILPGIEALLADRIDARIDNAGEAHAFDELRSLSVIRRRQIAPYAGALAFDDVVTAGRATLADAGSVEEFFERYTADWAQIDRLYRKIAGGIRGALQRAVETRYRLWLRDLTIHFTSFLAKRQAWTFKRSQRALGASFAHVEPKCAIVISDALRYEMPKICLTGS